MHSDIREVLKPVRTFRRRQNQLWRLCNTVGVSLTVDQLGQMDRIGDQIRTDAVCTLAERSAYDLAEAIADLV